jgi:hypothetical protein
VTLTDEDLRDILGPVGIGEYEASEDWAKPKLREWAAKLGDLSDDDFRSEAASAIHSSALVSRFRGNYEHEHCKATACYKEGQRRHVRDGHDEDCRGATLYSLAHADAMRSQGHRPSDPSPCTCGRGDA